MMMRNRGYVEMGEKRSSKERKRVVKLGDNR